MPTCYPNADFTLSLFSNSLRMSNAALSAQMDPIQRIRIIKKSIENACIRAKRDPLSVKLLAVTKTQPITTVINAYELGLREFGENYVQEGIDKISSFNKILPDHQAVWHFIGPLQSNKTRLIAENFDWVHSVDRLKIAQRLSEQRSQSVQPLNVLIQVNISAEDSKSGCTENEAIELALKMAQFPNIVLRGLMTIPASIDISADQQAQSAPFKDLTRLHNEIKQQLPSEAAKFFDTLSMGMSDDFEIAIQAGATLVRIGSALFGAREK